jgi:hypothetical protein
MAQCGITQFEKKLKKILQKYFYAYLCTPNQRNHYGFSEKWEHSSAGLEHLPYKQRVLGSIPSAPTEKAFESSKAFFILSRAGIK